MFAGDETLEMCTAAARLGLSATLPDDGGQQACLEALVTAVLRVCRGSRSLSDASRLRKYLSRFGLTWQDVVTAQSDFCS